MTRLRYVTVTSGRTTREAVLLDKGEHTLAFRLGRPTCLFHQGLLTARERQSGDIFCLLLQRFHRHDISFCRRAASPAAGANGSRATGQAVALTSGVALTACCRRSTSASRPAT